MNSAFALSCGEPTWLGALDMLLSQSRSSADELRIEALLDVTLATDVRLTVAEHFQFRVTVGAATGVRLRDGATRTDQHCEARSQWPQPTRRTTSPACRCVHGMKEHLDILDRFNSSELRSGE